jgi:integrase
LRWQRGRPRTTWEIHDCKFKSNRLLPLYSGLATILGRRRGAAGIIFQAPRSEDPWSETRRAQAFLTDAYAAAGSRRSGVMWHALRHTYASLLGAGGLKQHEIELLMGHKVAGTIGLYVHVIRETFEKVELIVDQAFGDSVRMRLADAAAAPAPAKPLPPRF